MEPAESDISPWRSEGEGGLDALETCEQAGETHDEVAVDHVFIGDLEAVARVARIGVGGELIKVADAIAVGVAIGSERGEFACGFSLPCVSDPVAIGVENRKLRGVGGGEIVPADIPTPCKAAQVAIGHDIDAVVIAGVAVLLAVRWLASACVNPAKVRRVKEAAAHGIARAEVIAGGGLGIDSSGVGCVEEASVSLSIRSKVLVVYWQALPS